MVDIANLHLSKEQVWRAELAQTLFLSEQKIIMSHV